MLLLALCAWAAAVGLGFAVLLRYESSPGPRPEILTRWPAGVPLQPHPSRLTLVLLAHPQCPCTRADLGELDRLVRLCPGTLHPMVVFLADPYRGEAWSRNGLWARATRIPGAELHADPDGRIAHGFGARTSGHTALFAPDGHTLYQGGITAARGHAGDSAGTAAILAIARGLPCRHSTAPVYGCALEEPWPAKEP